MISSLLKKLSGGGWPVGLNQCSRMSRNESIRLSVARCILRVRSGGLDSVPIRHASSNGPSPSCKIGTAETQFHVERRFRRVSNGKAVTFC